MEQRVGRLEYRMDKLEEKVEKQRIDFVETQVYVKEIYKRMDDIGKAIKEMKEKSGNEWKRFFEKFFWLLVGAAIAYFFNQ